MREAQMDLRAFKKNLEQEGIWVVQNISGTMKAYLKNKSPETYKEHINKYQAPVKVLTEADRVIFICPKFIIWAGIRSFDKNYVEPFTNKLGDIFLIAYRKGMKIILDSYDYNLATDQNFRADMVSSGYITEAEYDQYIDLDHRKNLPLINIVMV